MSVRANNTLLDAMYQPALLVDLTYRLQYANMPYCRLYQLNEASLRNIPLARITGEQYFQRHLKPHLDSVRGGGEQHLEVPLPTEDKGGGKARVTCLPDYGKDGRMSGIMLIYGQKRGFREEERLEQSVGAPDDDGQLRVCDRQFRKNTLWLSESALRLMKLSTEEDIFQYIGKNLSEMVDDAVVILNEIQEEEQIVVPRHVYGLEQHMLGKLIQAIGLNPVGKRYHLDPHLAAMYREQRIKAFEGGLREFARGHHQGHLMKHVEKLLNLKKIYTIGLNRENRLLSALHILKFNRPDINNITFVETFLHQASIALQRRILENELRQAKEKAEESERLKTAFLGNMSHEIRTPLNIIIGYVQMLGNSNLTEDKRQTYMDAIHHSSEQLLEIINDVLSMSKLETGQQQVQENHLNLNNLLLEIFTAYEPRAQRKGIDFRIQTSLPDDRSTISSDETKLRQILNNLLNNAFKFTEAGRIELGYRVKDEQLMLYVSDTGIGIPTRYQEQIFERFTQIESSDKRKYEGTGLGLSISRGLAELLGGKLHVESQTNQGTTFYLSLPLYRVQKTSHKEDNA